MSPSSPTAISSVVHGGRSVYCGWLPAVKCDGWVGWLPLKTSSLAALTEALTQLPDQMGSANLLAALRHDPALVIATLCYMFDDNGDEPTSLSDLADYWHCQGRSLWQQTDWLACPTDKDPTDAFARFLSLENYFQTLPTARWPQHAALWLARPDGTGGPTVIPFSSVRLTDDEFVSSEIANSHETITRLVNQLSPQLDREANLATSVDQIKRDLAHTLAYGLSHEINNPLANISTRAQSLSRVVTDESQRQSLLRIVDQTSRAHAMIADLMFYANPPSVDVQPFDVPARVASTLNGFTELAEQTSIQIETIIGPDAGDGIANGDGDMIGEAIGTLVQNAMEAIGTDGHVQVRIDMVADTESTGVWQIQVCDSGPGMTQAQVANAFDPYFSGREAGRGLGLGLCRAQRIAELHNGQIELQAALAGCVATMKWPSQRT